jgi:hypothetical protein
LFELVVAALLSGLRRQRRALILEDRPLPEGRDAFHRIPNFSRSMILKDRPLPDRPVAELLNFFLGERGQN